VRLLAAALLWLAGTAAAAAHEPAPPRPLDFEPPAPGTYTLHRIMVAPDAEVIGLDGRPAPLARFTHERITLLGLVYTTCVDPDGCPLALQVFDVLERTISETSRLRAAVRLVLLSIDPERDTPAAMRGYAGARARARADRVPWHFLTTRSMRTLAPILDGFGQDRRQAAGPGPRELSHVLKVFLVDRAGMVREIYSSAFLHPRTVLNDIDTLLMER
jgi:protein SCO1